MCRSLPTHPVSLLVHIAPRTSGVSFCTSGGLEAAFKAGNAFSKEIIESYAQAEFFTKLPEIDEKIEVVTFIAGVGDISTDLLSPGGDAHSRSDRELHGQCLFEHNAFQHNIVCCCTLCFGNVYLVLVLF